MRRRLGVLMAAALAACGAESAGNAPASPLDAAPNPVSDAITDAAPSLQGDTKVDAPPGPPLHVLFIGNSYTSVNDLPATLRGIAESSKAPPSMVTEAVAVAGATLADHYLGADARPAIAKGGVTHVVLQGQSVEPLVQPAMFQKYAVLLANDATDAGATPTFYETWARRAGDAVYQASWSGGSPGAMQDGLLKANMQAASGSGAGASVAKVGEAWRRALATAPSIVLHQDDGSHPTTAGTLLAAYVFYVTLTGNDVPESSVPPQGVSANDASTLRAIADAVAR